MRGSDDFCADWDLALSNEDALVQLAAQGSSSQSAAAEEALHLHFGDIDDDEALEELARAAEEIYDSDSAFDVGALAAFPEPEQHLVWHQSQLHPHARAVQQPQEQQQQQQQQQQQLQLPAATAAVAPPLPSTPTPHAATGQLGNATTAALLPLVQSRLATQALPGDRVSAGPAYVPPHLQYLFNRAAAQSGAIARAQPTPTAVAMPTVMQPALVGAEEMNTLYSKISSANAAQHEQRRHHRLARNRASARLRRKKKKTAVETLEAVATTLEQQLRCLGMHDYCAPLTDDVLSALEIDTAADVLPADARHSSWQSQMDLLQQLCTNMFEDGNMLATVRLAADQTAFGSAEENAETDGVQELLDVLNLRPAQAEQIRALQLHEASDRTSRLRTEVTQLQQLDCENNPLPNFAEDLKGFLTSNQIAKLSTWLELNRDVIEELDPLIARSDHDRRAASKDAAAAFVFDFSDRTVKPSSNTATS